MEELNKKVIGNATAAYFMVFVSLSFLFSSKPELNHPFVKAHVKSAFTLHLLMGILLFVMSYPFLDNIKIASYSLNTIITAIIALIIFAAILYAMNKAHKGQSVTLWEIFQKAGVSKNIVRTQSSQEIKEDEWSILMLAHIPFLWYIIGPKHMQLSHMRDILQLNFIVTLIVILIFIAGYSSLSSIILLAYIIWSVLQAVSITTGGKVISIGIDMLPSVEEKYIIQKSLLHYVKNTLKKNTFVPLSKIIATKTLERQTDEKHNAANIKSKYGYHTKNALILIILFIISLFIFGLSSPIILLFLFPICYSIGYSERVAYKMPYIYDLYAAVSSCLYKISHVFSRAKKLKNTTKNESIKMWEIKKES